MSVQTSTLDYQNYGRCLKLENEAAELLITLDVGPRIISYRLQGGENVLFNDLERSCCESGPEFDACFYPGAAWYTYGGHRLWASPEIYPTTYYPENDPVAYKLDGNTVTLLPPPQTYTHFQFGTEVTLDSRTSAVTVRHSIRNLYHKPLTVSPWAITVMAPGGFEVVPMPKRETGYLANRVLALWPYTNMSDNRVGWGEDHILLRQDPAVERPFKFGINSEHGWAAYVNRGAAFVKQFTPDPSLTYPDYGVQYETYTNAKFLEMETVGELKTLEPDACVGLEENWRLLPQEPFCPCDADQLAALLARVAR